MMFSIPGRLTPLAALVRHAAARPVLLLLLPFVLFFRFVLRFSRSPSSRASNTTQRKAFLYRSWSSTRSRTQLDCHSQSHGWKSAHFAVSGKSVRHGCDKREHYGFGFTASAVRVVHPRSHRCRTAMPSPLVCVRCARAAHAGPLGAAVAAAVAPTI